MYSSSLVKMAWQVPNILLSLIHSYPLIWHTSFYFDLYSCLLLFLSSYPNIIPSAFEVQSTSLDTGPCYLEVHDSSPSFRPLLSFIFVLLHNSFHLLLFIILCRCLCGTILLINFLHPVALQEWYTHPPPSKFFVLISIYLYYYLFFIHFFQYLLELTIY